MANDLIKEELHLLVDSCNNEVLLEQAKAILQSDTTKDWWDELVDDDKEDIAASERQYDAGEFISHAQLMQQLEPWKRQ